MVLCAYTWNNKLLSLILERILVCKRSSMLPVLRHVAKFYVYRGIMGLLTFLYQSSQAFKL